VISWQLWLAAAFRTLYVFVVMEIGSRRILHDRDRIFSEAVDQGRRSAGVAKVRASNRSPARNVIVVVSGHQLFERPGGGSTEGPRGLRSTEQRPLPCGREPANKPRKRP
jgi:hypothetical protein